MVLQAQSLDFELELSDTFIRCLQMVPQVLDLILLLQNDFFQLKEETEMS